jgi:hypothetical protein
MSSQETEVKSGPFLASYRIGDSTPGTPIFTVHLVVSTPDKTVNGVGVITQAVNPPLHVPTHLTGEYTYVNVLGSPTLKINLNLTGMGPINPIQPLVANNTRLSLLFNTDWQWATGNYEYRYGKDSNDWQSVVGVPATIIPNGNPQ